MPAYSTRADGSPIRPASDTVGCIPTIGPNAEAAAAPTIAVRRTRSTDPTIQAATAFAAAIYPGSASWRIYVTAFATVS
ncbi:hypothetical protein [Rhodoligotrophos defluvii]|uniref:hypothetical protein n=1 Tax=Rhodoligotrophos defluvii TaxID=2561934 RepID=UPI0010C9BF31|nr:hypothetical protein [Rhodoligotrophos defluvii]